MKAIEISSTNLRNTKGVTRLEKVYELNDQKFRIKYDNSNGDPMGFNYKMSLSGFCKATMKWNNLEDISSINMTRPIPNYFDDHGSLEHLKEFFELMEQKMVTVYS